MQGKQRHRRSIKLMAAESATIKRKVLVPVVQMVSAKGACDTCKKAGITAEWAYGTGAACA